MYFVIEFQKPINGDFILASYSFATREEAESKYYDVLRYAALPSEVNSVHGAYLFDIWNLIEHKVYDRRAPEES